MTLAIDKLNGHGLSNTACHEHQLQKDYQTVAISQSIKVIMVGGQYAVAHLKKFLASASQNNYNIIN